MTKTLGIPHIRDGEPSAIKVARWVREGTGTFRSSLFHDFAILLMFCTDFYPYLSEKTSANQ